MAIRYAVANGNWSNAATWDGGTLPTSADDVRSNGFTVTVDGNYTVLSVSNRSESSPVVAQGGTFSLSNGVTLTATATNGVIGGNAITTGAVTFSLASPNSANIVANCIGFVTGSGGIAVLHTGTGTLNITGNLTSGQTSSHTGLTVSGGGVVNVAGNTHSTTQTVIQVTGASARVYITGNCTSAATVSSINVTGTAAELHIVGTVNGNTSTNQSSTVSVTGRSAISSFVGPVVGGLSVAVSNNTAVLMSYFSGPFISSSAGVMPISCTKMAWIASPTGTYMELRTNDLLATRSLYTADYTTALHMPDVDDVRSGTVYGPSDELTGTCAVPPAGSVALGVPVDNTTGSAAITQQAIADAVGPLIAAYGA